MSPEGPEPQLPPSLRLLRRLVTALTVVMIAGFLVLIAALVMRLNAGGPSLPDSVALPEGARAADALTGRSRVLIAEACTHAPLSEDIGRVKIPALLRKRYGSALRVDIVSGVDFPEDLRPYDLIVHCGGCMFNRRYVLSRVQKAQACGVPITNYGVLLAKLTGVLDEVVLPAGGC